MATGHCLHPDKPAMIHTDVTRLLLRNVRNIRHTGIDRVNLEYARWAHTRGGGLCVRFGSQLRLLRGEAWPRLMLNGSQPGDARRRRHRLSLFVRSLAIKPPLAERSRVFVTTHSWLQSQSSWEWVRRRSIKAFVFIHDLIPIQFHEYSHPRERPLHEQRLDNSLRHARGLIVNSRCTESAVRTHAQQIGVPPPPILVAPLGHDLPAPDPEGPPAISRPYFVVLGTIEPRKNHLLLLTLWRELVKRHGAATPALVVIGRRGWECEQVVDLLERCGAIHPYLREVGEASDREVTALLSGARALLMPSFAEGYGLPVQEALDCGTPVISSPLPAIKEFAGDIPDYAEPHDGARWLELIENYSQPDSDLRQAQLRRLHGFHAPKWHEHFSLVEDFMESVG